MQELKFTRLQHDPHCLIAAKLGLHVNSMKAESGQQKWNLWERQDTLIWTVKRI